MKKEIILLACLLSGYIPAQASQWIDIAKVGGESYLLRQGDRASLKRTGPWAEFSQRWLRYREGVLINEAHEHEIMAVNCLTGARSAKAHYATDPDTEQRVLITESFSEIEQGTSPYSRIDITTPEKGLDANLIKFACSCPNPQASKPGDENTLLRIYDAFIQEQTKEVGYRMRHKRYFTRNGAIAALKKFEQASAAPVDGRTRPISNFPGKDLGEHPVSDWGPTSAKIFRTMKPGEYTQQPINGIYGYEIYFMESRYEKPAAPFKVWRAAIQTYANREQSCGRKIF